MSKPQKYDPKKLKSHPLGAIFPPLSDPEYAQLKKSIKSNGFDPNHPIWIYENAVLDGNNRLTASVAVKVEPVFKEYVGTDPIGFVIRENLARRSLTPSQAATLGAELLEKIKEIEKAEKEAEKAKEKAAKEAAKAAGTKAPKPDKKKSKGSRAKKAADALNVSERSVAAAAALKKDDPQGFEEVKSGKKSLNAATTDAAVKKSAKDREDEAFVTACATIDRVIQEGFSEKIKSKISTKDIIKFSGLDEEEMIRVAPLMDAGWKLKDAMGYKAVTLTLAHPIRQLVDRAIAQGGTFELLADGYGTEWQINVQKRGSVAS